MLITASASFAACSGRIAEQDEGLAHVVHITVAQFGEARRGVQVVVAIRKREPALAGSRNLLGGILLVLRNADGEEGAAAATILFGVEGCEVLLVCECGNGIQLRLQRLYAQLVDESVFMQAAKKSPYFFWSGVLGALAAASSSFQTR